MAFELIATTTFGIEAIAAEELRSLGYSDLWVENGKVSFRGETNDLARINYQYFGALPRREKASSDRIDI